MIGIGRKAETNVSLGELFDAAVIAPEGMGEKDTSIASKGANRRRRLIPAVAAVGSISLGSLGIGAAPAQAESDVPPKIVGIANATFHEVGQVSASAISVTKANLDSEGRINLYPINSDKAPKFTKNDLEGVPFAKSYKLGKKTGEPFKLSNDKKFPTTYEEADGDVQNLRRPVREPYSAFAPNAAGKYFHFGYFNEKTGKWEDRCKNPEKKKGAPSLKYSEVNIVQGSKMEYKSTIGLHQQVVGNASATVEITKPEGKCNTTVGVKATLDEQMQSEVRVRARTLSQATVKAIGLAVRNYASNHDQAFIKTTQNVDGKWAFDGSVSLDCTFTPGETPPTPPQPENESKIESITHINDVLQYNYRNYSVSTLTQGNAMVYSFPRNGGTITSNQAAQVGPGLNTVTAEYKAGERPSANPQYNLQAGKDRVDIKLVATDTNRTLDEASSNDFEITVPIADPLKHDKGAVR